jgi:hypothetical protein
VIAKAMAKKRGHRYAKASDLARDLRAALTGVAVPPVEPPAAPSGRRKRPTTVDVTGKTMPGQADK